MKSVIIEAYSIGEVFKSGYVVGHTPARTISLPEGRHWVYVYTNIPNDAIVFEFGRDEIGNFWKEAHLVNGKPVPEDRMQELEACPEWKGEVI